MWHVAQWVCRAPPHHTLPAFLNLNGIIWFFLMHFLDPKYFHEKSLFNWRTGAHQKKYIASWLKQKFSTAFKKGWDITFLAFNPITATSYNFLIMIYVLRFSHLLCLFDSQIFTESHIPFSVGSSMLNLQPYSLRIKLLQTLLVP